MSHRMYHRTDGSTTFETPVGSSDDSAECPLMLVGQQARMADASITVAAEGSNSIAVSIQLKDMNGNDLDHRRSIRAYLSEDANGDGLTSTTLNGTVGIGTDGLAIETVTKKAWWLTCEADGDIDMVFGDSGNIAPQYLVLCMPDGRLVVSGAIDLA